MALQYNVNGAHQDPETSVVRSSGPEAETGGGCAARPTREATFDELARLIEDDYAVKGNRATANMQLRLTRLRKFFRGDETASGIEARWPVYVSMRLAEVKLTTVNEEGSTLRRMFKLGHLHGQRVAKRPLGIRRLGSKRVGSARRRRSRKAIATDRGLPALLSRQEVERRTFQSRFIKRALKDFASWRRRSQYLRNASPELAAILEATDRLRPEQEVVFFAVDRRRSE